MSNDPKVLVYDIQNGQNHRDKKKTSGCVLFIYAYISNFFNDKSTM